MQDKIEALEKDRETTKLVLNSLGHQYSTLDIGAKSGDSLVRVASRAEPPVSFETKSLFDNVSPPILYNQPSEPLPTSLRGSSSPFRIHSVSPPKQLVDEEPIFKAPHVKLGHVEPHFAKVLEIEIAKEQEYRHRLEEENRQV